MPLLSSHAAAVGNQPELVAVSDHTAGVGKQPELGVVSSRRVKIAKPVEQPRQLDPMGEEIRDAVLFL